MVANLTWTIFSNTRGVETSSHIINFLRFHHAKTTIKHTNHKYSQQNLYKI